METQLFTPEIESPINNKTFNLYTATVGNGSDKYPAYLGLHKEEFEDALNDPEVAKTEISIGGESYSFPQVSTLDKYKWLNSDFYKEKFPEQYRNGSLVHYEDLPGIQPGPDVLAKLSEVAKKDGVLVFDYPSNDPEYPERVARVLDSLGIVPTTGLEVLGTQTYFVGKVKIKTEHEKLDQPLRLYDSFTKLIENGSYDIAKFQDGASFEKTVSEDEAKDMNHFYDAAFEVLNNHPCRQGLGPKEFMEVVSYDKDVVKVVYRKEGEVVSMCLLSEDLSKFDWINPKFYERISTDEKKNIIYFPALATNPDKKGELYTQKMINLISAAVEAGDNEVIVAFDCCDVNNGFLDKFLEAMINRTKETSINIEPVAIQRYCAIGISLA